MRTSDETGRRQQRRSTEYGADDVRRYQKKSSGHETDDGRRQQRKGAGYTEDDVRRYQKKSSGHGADDVRKFTKEQPAGELRLNRYLSDAGVCSRREADRLIEAGRVSVDGKTAAQGQKVARGQQVLVDGRRVEPEQEMILLAVNKPRGVVCTTDRRWGDRTIYDVVNYPKRIFSVGRLDKDSEGLLLMTNYGDILNKIMRAGNYHEKEYLVTVDRDITPEFLSRMAAGVYLKELDVTTRPCRIELAGKCRFRLVLTQGLNRQIRRMCEALHYRVKRLIRVRVMNIELGDLKPGEYRAVTRKEFTQLQEQLRYSHNPGKES